MFKYRTGYAVCVKLDADRVWQVSTTQCVHLETVLKGDWWRLEGDGPIYAAVRGRPIAMLPFATADIPRRWRMGRNWAGPGRPVSDISRGLCCSLHDVPTAVSDELIIGFPQFVRFWRNVRRC